MKIQRSKTSMSWLAVFTALAIVLSACVAPPQTAAPSPEQPAASTEQVVPTIAPAELTKLSFWFLGTSPGRIEATKQALALCAEKYPNISVEPTYYNYDDYSKAMPAALAAGNPPDFSFADPTAPNMPNYVAAGQVVPIADLIKEYGWDKKVSPSAITFYDPLYGDQSYGVPMILALRGLFYNKDILKELGGQVPTTMDEFEALLAKAKEKGYTPLLMGNSDKWGADYYWENLLFLYLANEDWKSFVSGTMKQQPGVAWGGEAARKAMAKLLEWKDKGYLNADFASLGSGDLHSTFAQGKAFAYSNDLSQNASLIEDKPQFEVGFMNWPRIYPDKPLLALSDPGNLLITPKDSKHPKEAAQIIDCLLTPEVGKLYAESGDIPLQQNVDLAAVTVPVSFIKDQLAAVADQTPIGWLNYMAPPDFPDKQGSELQKLLAGEVTLDEYMATVQKLYDDAIANK